MTLPPFQKRPETGPNPAERHAQLEAILRNAVDAIITIDEQGVIESVNPATETMFGYSATELVGQNVKRLMPSPYREEHDKYLARHRRTGKGTILGIGREVVGRKKSGETFPIHLAVSAIGVGPRQLFTGIVRDVSDLKAAEQRLANMNEELEARVRQRTADLHATQAELLKKEKLATLGQIAGGIAHEIRNPLNAIKTSAYYLLHAQSASPEKQAEHLDRIDRQVTMIDKAITALSDAARLPEPTLQPIDLSGCLHRVVEDVALPDEIRVVWEIADSLPLVMADADQIPIVFRNLLRNARDAMQEGGTLTITATFSHDQVEVAISDTGIGIGDGAINRIMEPLYSTKARGMGLGLVISRTILDKHRGTLQVRSQLGSGSTFMVALRTASMVALRAASGLNDTEHPKGGYAMTNDEKVVKVYTLNDPNQAEILKNLLLDHDIDCVLDGEGQAGFTGTLEIDVLVKSSDADEAIGILKSHHVDKSLEEE